MIKVICVILLSVLLLQTGKGQLRHSQGDVMAGVAYGAGNQTSLYSFGVCYYLNSEMGLKAASYLQKVRFNITNFNGYYLQPDFFYSILNNHRSLYLNIKAGMLMGMEFWKNEMLEDEQTNFYYGETIGISLEWFISPNLKMELVAEQQFWHQSMLALYRPFVKLGFYHSI